MHFEVCQKEKKKATNLFSGERNELVTGDKKVEWLNSCFISVSERK